MKKLYEHLIARLMETGLTRKQSEHLFILAVEDCVVAMDDMMLEQGDNFLARLIQEDSSIVS